MTFSHNSLGGGIKVTLLKLPGGITNSPMVNYKNADH